MYIVRNFRWDDLPELLDLINLSLRADGDENVMIEGALRHQLTSPGVHPEQDSFMAVTPDGKLIGASFVRLMLGSGRGTSNGAVHPDYRSRGVGTALLRAGDAFLLRCAETDTPGDSPIFMQRVTLAVNTSAKALLEAEGYTAVREFYAMRIALDSPQLQAPAGKVPAGITLRPFDLARDGRAVYDAYLDSFGGHWGFVPMSYEMWQHKYHDQSRIDFDLWAIAAAGDEIVGFSVNRAWGPDQPDFGWIELIGVRRPWRKQGIGEALLYETFARGKAHGLTGIGLTVDASNPTGAVALYERVGMYVYRQQITYRKVLRGRPEDIQE